MNEERLIALGREEDDDSESSLKMIAHNNLIGRIIGKQGVTIKSIMEETGTSIAVSSINDMSQFNMDRTITITSKNVDDVSRAEALISSKLRDAFEADVHGMAVRNNDFFLLSMFVVVL